MEKLLNAVYTASANNRDELCTDTVSASLKQGESGLGQGRIAFHHIGSPLAGGKLEGKGNFGKRSLCAEVS